MVPNGWKYTQADKICSVITKGTTPPKNEVSDQGEIPFLRVNNLTFNGVIDYSSKMIFVSEESHRNFLSRSIAYPNDVLMNIVGPPLGKTALLDNTYPEYNLNQAIVFYRLNNKIVDSSFFLSYINSYTAQQWLQSQSKKTSGQQNLTIAICKELPILLPPIPVQQKIAKILSTWDKAIDATEKLISNSQTQKRALMQQLLTGKKRLLNENGVRFSGKWEKVLLGNISDMSSGGTPLSSKPEYYGNDILWVSIADMTSQGKYIFDTHKKLTLLGLENSSAKIFPKNTILYAMYASIGECSIAMKEVSTSQAILGIRPHLTLNYKFLYFFLNSIKEKIKLQGQQGTQSNLNAAMVKAFKIPLPSLKEQIAITNVLSNSDREIELLKKKLVYLKQEKKALMQQLLTGKRRVTIN